MSKFQDLIKQVISEFVTRIHTIATEAAMETLQDSLSDKSLVAAIANGAGGKSKSNKSAKTVSTSSTRQKGEKRKPEEIEALRERLLAHIRENPGQRIEEINASLGTSTSEVQRPIKHLLSAGSIRTEGQLRATRYFPKGKGGAAAKKAAKKAPVAKKSTSKKTVAPAKKPAKKAPAAKKATAKKAAKKAPAPEVVEDAGSSDPTANAEVVQRTQIEDALKASNGNIAAAAKALGNPESTLRTMIKRLGIKVEKAKTAAAA
jgi:DNA-binding NtrC family response regulator